VPPVRDAAGKFKTSDSETSRRWTNAERLAIVTEAFEYGAVSGRSPSGVGSRRRRSIFGDGSRGAQRLSTRASPALSGSLRQRLESRVKAHIFLSMLAYYVQWHMIQAWASLTFKDEAGAEVSRKRNPVAPPKRSKAALDKVHTRRCLTAHRR